MIHPSPHFLCEMVYLAISGTSIRNKHVAFDVLYHIMNETYAVIDA